MYNRINIHIDKLLNTILQEHVNEYDWLRENVRLCANDEYRRKYKHFWRLNVARLNADYREAYFQRLEEALANPPILKNLALNLYDIPTQRNGKRSLQFAFATKLLHMVRPRTPIYDDRIAAFYFFKEHHHRRDINGRIDELMRFHTFLEKEYKRILKEGLLTVSIEAFKQRFNPLHFTDEKVIDSLLWTYVDFLRDDGLINGTIIYL